VFPSLLPQGSHCGPAFRVEVWTGARSLVGGMCTMHHQLFCWNSHEHNEMQRMCGGRYPAKKLQTRYCSLLNFAGTQQEGDKNNSGNSRLRPCKDSF